jgi:peptidyl-dipeptidase Dcp
MDYTGDILDRASSIFFNLNSAETNDEMQKIAQEVSPLYQILNDIRLNPELFARVKSSL